MKQEEKSGKKGYDWDSWHEEARKILDPDLKELFDSSECAHGDSPDDGKILCLQILRNQKRLRR